DTSAPFTGVNGHTYSFYSVAFDNVGNLQPTPALAQASTTVDDLPPNSSVAALPSFSPGSFTVGWSGSDNGGSRVAFSHLYAPDHGAAPALFQSVMTATSTQFTGQDGHNYTFYTPATNNAARVQTPAGTAQKTPVDANPPATAEKETG